MKEDGWMVKSMGLEFTIAKMEINTKEIMKWVKKMAMVL